MPPVLVRHFMHRCGNPSCNRFFSKTLDNEERCFCGGEFLVDKNYHPDYGGPGINGTPNPFAAATTLKLAP